MDPRKENWRYFNENYPAARDAYEAFGKALHEEGGPLDEKTVALIKVGVAAASQYDWGLKSHIEKALKVGCEPSEIEHSILLTATTIGFPRMMAALMIWRNEKAARNL